MTDSRTDLDKELSEIKREVIEGRNLVIKTDNLLKNLHAELKAVGKKQEEFEKRKLFSSGVAYALFAVLAMLGAIGISNVRVSSAEDETAQAQKAVEELTQKLSEQKAADAARDKLQQQAFAIFRDMTERPGDERLKGVDAFAKLDTRGLSPLERAALSKQAELLRVEIGQAAFERGKQAFRRNDMKEAEKHLSRFMAMNPSPEDTADASFFLGVAYNQLRQHDKAVPLLAHFVEMDKKSRVRDYAMLLLAQSYEQTGALQKAADTARQALGTYPASQFASQLRGRLATVKRAMGQGGSGPGPGTPSEAASPAPVKPTKPAAKPASGAAPAPKPAAQ